MTDDNKKERSAIAAIGMVMLLTAAGIGIFLGVGGSRKEEDSQSRLQAEIMEYAGGAEEDGEEFRRMGDRKQAAQASGEQERLQEAGGADPERAAAESGLDLARILSEMKGYWEAGNMEAVGDLAHLPRYLEASGLLAGTTRFYYMGDTDSRNQPHGKGLAIYADNQYYYGDWEDGVRSGSGMWIKYYVYEEGAADGLYLLHSYSGEWDGDLPNGEGAEHYDFVEENLEKEEGYNRNFIGSFRDGLYDGEIYITNYYSGGNVKEWSGTARQGVWEPLGDKDQQGRYPVIVELKNKDNYQWIYEKENKNAGVDGLISPVK
ncbi:MAG: hypothetical protein MR430_07835 [Lachnospiraceae bacterium]|nr:hypothetical protein [Lachnospiraceae bacterium]